MLLKSHKKALIIVPILLIACLALLVSSNPYKIIPNTNITLNMTEIKFHNELGDPNKTYNLDGNEYEEYKIDIDGKEFCLTGRFRGIIFKRLVEIDCTSSADKHDIEHYKKYFLNYYTDEHFNITEKVCNNDEVEWIINNSVSVKFYYFENLFHITFDSNLT